MGPPYQRSMRARAIDVGPGSRMPLSASAICSRVNQRTSRISSPSGTPDGRGAHRDPRLEPEHERGRERPGLARDVARILDQHARLLVDLADHGRLERLPRLHESGEQRDSAGPPTSRWSPSRMRSSCVGDRDDDRGVGAREVLLPGRRVDAHPAGLRRRRSRAPVRGENADASCQLARASASVKMPGIAVVEQRPEPPEVAPVAADDARSRRRRTTIARRSACRPVHRARG